VNDAAFMQIFRTSGDLIQQFFNVCVFDTIRLFSNDFAQSATSNVLHHHKLLASFRLLDVKDA